MGCLGEDVIRDTNQELLIDEYRYRSRVIIIFLSEIIFLWLLFWNGKFKKYILIEFIFLTTF